MCMKYSLQDVPESRLCDCVTRRREDIMSYAHHTFLVNCQTGTCICLSGDPRPAATPNAPPKRDIPLIRDLLGSCLASSGKKQMVPELSTGPKTDKPVAGTSPITGYNQTSANSNQKRSLFKRLRENVKTRVRDLSCCVPVQRDRPGLA